MRGPGSGLGHDEGGERMVKMGCLNLLCELCGYQHLLYRMVAA